MPKNASARSNDYFLERLRLERPDVLRDLNSGKHATAAAAFRAVSCHIPEGPSLPTRVRHRAKGGTGHHHGPVAAGPWFLSSYNRPGRHCIDRRSGMAEVRVAYNLASFLRCIELPEAMADWSLTSLQLKLIKIGARVVRHARAITFQLAEVTVTGAMVRAILAAIRRLRAPPLCA